MKQNNEVMILRSDNGSNVILINTTDYITKMNSSLDDQLRFEVDKFNKDLSDLTEKQIISILKEHLKMKTITNYNYNDLKSLVLSLPQMNDLPMVHKHDIPVRLIHCITKLHAGWQKG